MESQGDPVSVGAPRVSSRLRFGFTFKLFSMVAIPLVGLVMMLGLEISKHVARQGEMQSLMAGSALIVDAERLIDEFQSERGLSSFYLSLDGSLHHRELVDQWQVTDTALATFNSALTRLDAPRESRFFALEDSDVHDGLDRVTGMRRGILDMESSWSESLEFYSDLIEDLHALSFNLASQTHTDPELASLFMGFLDLSESVEAAAVEKAVISKALTKGTIDEGDLDLLGRLAGRQEASLRAYRRHVPPEMRSVYQVHLTPAGMRSITEIRERLAYGDFSLAPQAWYDIADTRIDALQRAESNLLTDLVSRSTELADEERTAIWRFSAFGVFVLAGSLLVSDRVGRRIARRTNKLAEVAHAIQTGDFTQRAEDNIGDELGTLGFAFNQMTDDLTTLNRTLETQVEERTTQLAASEARSRAMLDAIPDLIIRLDETGVYVDFEVPRASDVFPSTEQFVGKHINEVLAPTVASKVMSASRRAHLSSEVQHMEYQFPMGEEIRDREARIVAIPESQETLLVVRDITERKAAERRLQELIRSKDELIASISHELRTPLTSVVGFAELLQETESGLSPAEKEEMLTSITEQASDIADIIEDLLVAARAEIDTLHIARVPVNLRAQLSQVFEASRELLHDQIEIIGPPVIAIGDPGRVRQILRNLLTNASRHGGDNIQVRMHATATTAAIQVCDDGPGIPEQDREAIFEPYHQFPTTPGLPGSVGLGLTVSRTLARLMGGDLTYRHQNGTSIFELTLTTPDETSIPDA